MHGLMVHIVEDIYEEEKEPIHWRHVYLINKEDYDNLLLNANSNIAVYDLYSNNMNVSTLLQIAQGLAKVDRSLAQ